MRKLDHSHKIALFSGIFHATRMLIGAMQALYLLKSGLSLHNLALLKSYFALLVLIFDVPFGMLGDFISNKLCIYLSCLFVALYYIFSMYSPNLPLLIIAESLYAMGLCLISGSLESLLIHAVKLDYPNNNAKISYFYFLSGEIMSVGSMITAPLGVLIFIFIGDMRAIYFLCFIFVIILPILIYTIDESTLYKNKVKIALSISYFKSIILDEKNRIYILVASLIVIAYQPIYHFWQPLFMNFSINIPKQILSDDGNKTTAVILAIVFFLYSLSNYISNKLAKKRLSLHYDSFFITSLISFFLLISILCMVWIKETRLVLLTAVFSCTHGLMTIFSNLSKSVLIANTKKQHIATVISISNVIGRLFSTVILFLCSMLINNTFLQYVFILTFVSMLFATIIYLKNYDPRKSS